MEGNELILDCSDYTNSNPPANYKWISPTLSDSYEYLDSFYYYFEEFLINGDDTFDFSDQVISNPLTLTNISGWVWHVVFQFTINSVKINCVNYFHVYIPFIIVW